MKPFRFGARWREPLAGGWVYCRCSYRPARGGALLRCLDVADIWLPDDERGRGVFSRYLAGLEEQFPREDYDAIYVENVLNPRLAAFFARRKGYALAAPWTESDGSPCFMRVSRTKVLTS